MTTTVKVGGDIDAWCTRCKMQLGHTVLAMVGTRAARVRCNTCQGEHNYKASGGEPKKGSWEPKVDRERRLARPTVTSWEALLAKKDLTRARRYSVKERFETDDVLDHPVFGIGLVQEVNGDKMRVAFKADVKLLVHGKAAQ
jgi:hypothetical protein